MNNIKLSNGFQVPPICYGTDIIPEYFYDISCGPFLSDAIRFARAIKKGDIQKYKKYKGICSCIEAGLKNEISFFDTSRAYGGSELMLSDKIKKHSRNNIILCTKLCNDHQLKGIPARDSLIESMKRLGVDYIDIYLLHWPVENRYLDYWKQLEDIYDEGLVKAIGVSNCKIHHLDKLLEFARVVPMINEVELHPLLSEVELRNYCNINNIQIMAYSCTARYDFRLRNSRRLDSVCKKHNKSLAQVIIRWHIQNGVIPVFNTSVVDHYKDNMDVFDFALSDEDMEKINSININSRTRYDSDNCEWDML